MNTITRTLTKECFLTKGEFYSGPRLKVLLIAYACEPNHGSEPGTGWNMALGLAARHEITVATRANNRGPIEAALRDTPKDNRPKFLYLDPPAWTLWLKARKMMPIQIFYFFWQQAVAKHIHDSGDRFDILHQLTFNSFEIPPLSFASMAGVKIWGPIGGGQTVSSGLLRAFGPASLAKESFRNLRVTLSAKTPWVRHALRRSALVLFANRETSDLLSPLCNHKTTMMIDVGVDISKFRPSSGDHVSHNGVTFLAAGRLEARKGFRLLVDAFALFMAEHPEARLRILGDGPERRRLEKQINARGMDNAVALLGAVSHDEMRREFETAEAFVFPSLRDTSGAVVLEAMAMCLPIICLDHQGAAIMVADGCGIKIQPGTYSSTIKAMREALARLASDSDMRKQLGANARRHALKNFSWDEKLKRMIKIYESAARDVAKPQ